MKPEFTRSSANRSMACLFAGLGTMLLGITVPASADDTSVYAAQLANQQKPNILFVLDYSGSMTRDVAGNRVAQSGQDARITILKRAVNTLLEKNDGKINAGLGSLFSTYAGGVRWPIGALDADAHTIDPAIPPDTFTSRQIIEKQLERVPASGNTATVNALVDAALYFRGGRVANDDRPVDEPDLYRPDTWDTEQDRYQGGVANTALPASYLPRDAYVSDAGVEGQVGYCYDYSPGGGVNDCAGKVTLDCEAIDARDSAATFPASRGDGRFNSCTYQHPDYWRGATYEPPLTQMCQSNYIVLISDGQPTVRNTGDALTEVLGGSADDCADLSSSIFNAAPGTNPAGNCGPEIVRKLARVGEPVEAGVPDTRVTTYTIGFSVAGPGQNYLRKLAESSGVDANGEQKGKFLNAEDETQLANALSQVLDEITTGSENFSELSVDVNRATFSNDDRAYLNLFSPSVNRSWAGNLKGFFVKSDGLFDTNDVPALATLPPVDADSADVGQESVFFAEQMQSFWSSTADGNDVAKGGANEALIDGNRNLYTFTGTLIPDNGVALNRNVNRLSAANGAVTAAMLGLPPGSGDRSSLLEWLATAPMGDPLHSKPVRVEYETSTGSGNAAASTTQQVVYTMTNQGLLHAFDATRPGSGSPGDHGGGEELFAFMPPGLLTNLPEIRENTDTGSHIYGLDGDITRWHDDANHDGKVNGDDTVMLVLGMRRGGSSYHALDVTDPQNPRYLWRIVGGSTGFEQLAQTWSRASLITVKSGAGSERVLAFGGGYDAQALDNVNERKPSRGNAIYIVDRDGDRLWSTSDAPDAAMQYAIPSDLTPIDSDADGLADRLYAGDTGGQVWRVDFDDVTDASGFDVNLLADLHYGDHQPFFYPPTVAFNQGAEGDYLSIALGSGNRTQPLLANTQNAFFMLRDTQLEKGAADNPSPIAIGDLYDTTANEIASSDNDIATRAAEALAAKRGWRISLADGEKALSQLVSFEGQLMATTYEADMGTDDDACTFDTIRRFYRMDLADGRPLAQSSDEDSAAVERFERLEGRGIPSAPVVVFPPNTSMGQVMVDKKVVNLFDQQLKRVYWHSR